MSNYLETTNSNNNNNSYKNIITTAATTSTTYEMTDIQKYIFDTNGYIIIPNVFNPLDVGNH